MGVVRECIPLDLKRKKQGMINYYEIELNNDR